MTIEIFVCVKYSIIMMIIITIIIMIIIIIVIIMIPMIIGALGGGMKALKNELKKVFKDQGLINNVAGEMQRTVLMDSESIIRRVMFGLI